MEVREKRWPMRLVSAVSWRRQNIKEGMITWHGISADNFVVNVNWTEIIAERLVRESLTARNKFYSSTVRLACL